MSDQPDTEQTDDNDPDEAPTVTAGGREGEAESEAGHDDEVDTPAKSGKRSDREARYRIRAKQAEAKVEDLTAEVRTLRMRLAFNSAATGANLTDADAAWKLASDDLRAVDVSEDGKVDTDRIGQIVAHVAERYPYLASETSPSPSPAETPTFAPVLPSGRQTNGAKKSPPLDVAALEQRFPALARNRNR